MGTLLLSCFLVQQSIGALNSSIETKETSLWLLKIFCISCNISRLIRSIWMRQKGSDDLNDSEIIDLFYARSERAIMELSAKYGNVCNKVAKNILSNILDAEECPAAQR